MIKDKQVNKIIRCYHCGEPCREVYVSGEQSFCCFGCKTVFEILSSNDLCQYYSIHQNPGTRQLESENDLLSCLDEASIRARLLDFSSDSYARVVFHAPAIHCSSCIWLLENLSRLDKGIIRSRVNFTSKQITIEYNPEKTTLASLAKLLKSLGYPPMVDLGKKPKSSIDKNLIMKLAVAGFCFGNVMLLSFPEYLGLTDSDAFLRNIFPWLNLLLSLPVLFYSGSDYFTSAWNSLKLRQINIDVPVALGLAVLMTRSFWDIYTSQGSGYLDSLTGLVFFLLIGKWFQNQTYQGLAFDRDFKAYFPLAIRKFINGDWKPTVIFELKPGDIIQVRNNEIIPADSRLTSPGLVINYSFVTGESTPVTAEKDEIIYAGGQVIGLPAELEVLKETSQSYLTDIWNREIFRKEHRGFQKLIDRIAKSFTIVVLLISIFTVVWWSFNNPSMVWLNVSAVLIVACPCALALATPFTYGTLMQVFGRNDFYLKNSETGEKMAEVDTFVFDKTGTLTHGENPEVNFRGTLTNNEIVFIQRLAELSIHPLSKMIAAALPSGSGVEKLSVSGFEEIPGKGISGIIHDQRIKIGSASYVGKEEFGPDQHSRVFISINGEVRGHFEIAASFRAGVKKVFKELNGKVHAIISGDNNSDEPRFRKITDHQTRILFNQSAEDKLEFVRQLQNNGHKVMMLGDGLNDAGALQQSNLGIAVTDDTGLFTPACDGILKGSRLKDLIAFIGLSKFARKILIIAFILSFLYNVLALAYAVSGNLTPLFAAILMPLSSITVVAFCSFSIRLKGYLTFDRK